MGSGEAISAGATCLLEELRRSPEGGAHLPPAPRQSTLPARPCRASSSLAPEEVIGVVAVYRYKRWVCATSGAAASRRPAVSRRVLATGRGWSSRLPRSPPDLRSRRASPLPRP